MGQKFYAIDLTHGRYVPLGGGNEALPNFRPSAASEVVINRRSEPRRSLSNYDSTSPSSITARPCFREHVGYPNVLGMLLN